MSELRVLDSKNIFVKDETNYSGEYFFISHIVRDELPTRGLAKLYFYTKKQDKYYWGLDNNSFQEEYMKDLEDKNQVIKLAKPLKVRKDGRKTIWADSDGNVYLADIKNPYSDKIGLLENIFFK